MIGRDELERLVNDYALHCGGPGDEWCDTCPWNSEANDVACAAYVIDAAANPQRYELRGGLVEPTGAARSSEAGRFPAPSAAEELLAVADECDEADVDGVAGWGARIRRAVAQ